MLPVLIPIANGFDQKFAQETSQELHGLSLDVIQVNVGLVCNQACVHCHVESSPKRTEVMDWPIMELILQAASQVNCQLVDITGGAPELNPHLRDFIAALRLQGQQVQVRTNLTVLLEPEMETMAQFFYDHQVKLVASLPCYLEQNVNQQRGSGVFEKSIQAIKNLNALGYGTHPAYQLNLVYNPLGPFLPPEQSTLEAAYRNELFQHFGISFTNLLTLTNMPIGRFLADLRHQKKDGRYQQLLADSFNPHTLERLMCRHQIEIDWDGHLYDCDFNLALKLGIDSRLPRHIKDFDPIAFIRRKISTGNHCFGCTAGHGSSCSGSLT